MLAKRSYRTGGVDESCPTRGILWHPAIAYDGRIVFQVRYCSVDEGHLLLVGTRGPDVVDPDGLALSDVDVGLDGRGEIGPLRLDRIGSAEPVHS